MAIFNPEMHISRADKELLLLLGGLLTGGSKTNLGNYTATEIPLSDREAGRLIELLEELVTSKKFLESSYFVEELSQGKNANFCSLRDIFSFWRRRTGRSRSMAWLHWNDFLARYSSDFGSERSHHLPKIREMDFTYFLRMENILLSAMPLSPQVRSLILQVIGKYEADIEAARRGMRALPAGMIKAQPEALLNKLRAARDSGIGLPVFSAQQIAGIATLVADSSVLFTTRDWGVAGTFSTMAGAIAASSSK